MSALSLFVLCCAFVQVQSLSPYVFSSRTYYHADSTNAPNTDSSLASAVFHCRFNTPLGSIAGWDDTNEAAVLAGIQAEVIGESIGLTAVGVPKSADIYGFDFTLRQEVGTVFPSASASKVSIQAMPGFFCKPDSGACVQDGANTNNVASPVFPVKVGSTFTFGVDWNSQAVDELSALFTFNHEAYNMVDNTPFSFTVDGDLAPLSSEVFVAVTPFQWLFNIDIATPGTKVCLVPTDGVEGPVVSDVYGNYLVGKDLISDDRMCFTTPDVQLCGDWGEWSNTCVWKGCIPIMSDRPLNVQTRTRVSEAYPDCNIPPETRECIYTSDFQPCQVFIEASETGDECANNCNSGGLIEGVGCQCGGTCVEDGNCCQSYFTKCIGEEEATTDPLYFYAYAPCWKPSTCSNAAPVPPSTFGCGTTSKHTADGYCNSRPYKYGCYCGFSPLSGLTCQDVGGNDLCCNGGDSWSSICSK